MVSKREWLVLVFLLFLVLVGFSSAERSVADSVVSLPSDVSAALERDGVVDVFVNFREGGAGIAGARSVRDRVLRDVGSVPLERVERFGVSSSSIVVKHEYADTSSVAVRVSRAGLARLQRHSLVDSVSIDRVVSLSSLETSGYGVALQSAVPVIAGNESWGLDVGGVNITGLGRSVCIIDSGIDADHPAFGSRVVDQRCFCSVSGVPCCNGGVSFNATNASDDETDSHGTHVAGIVGAAPPGDFRGVAPNVSFVVVKACNSVGSCSLSDLAKGLEYCGNVSQQFNISVTGMSVGDHQSYTSSTCPSDLNSQINALYSKRVLFAAASDNQNHASGVSHPSCSPNTTSVGATTDSDAIASFSNRGGDRFDIFAPGVSINSTIVNGYASLDGTSMATPMFSGAAILVYQALNLSNRSMTPVQVESLLKETGVPVSNWSRVDVGAALVQLLYNYSLNRSSRTVFGNVSRVSFSAGVPLSRAGPCSNIAFGSVFVNTSGTCNVLNVSGSLIMNNLSFNQTPAVFRDGISCSVCSNISYVNSTASFSTSSFGNLTLVRNANLSLSDSSDLGNLAVNTTAFFYANYSNVSSGAGLNLSNACSFSLNLSSTLVTANMTLNQSSGSYVFNTSIGVNGSWSWVVNCSGGGFEPLTVADTVLVKEDLVPPTISSLFPLNDSVMYSSNVSVNFTALDNFYSSLSYQLLLNGSLNASGGALNGSSSAHVLNLSDGAYNVTIIVIDGSSNNVSRSSLFWVDGGSRVLLESPLAFANSTSLNVSFFWNVSHSSVPTINCSLGVGGALLFNTSQENGSSKNASLVLSEGVHSWNASCVYNRFGGTRNISSETRSLTVDASAPTLSILNYSNNSVVNSSNALSFLVNVSENVSSPRSCSLFVNDSLNRVVNVSNGVNMLNDTLVNSSYSWSVSCDNSFSLNTTTPPRLLTVAVSNAPPSWSNVVNSSTLEDATLIVNFSSWVVDAQGDPLYFFANSSNMSSSVVNDSRILTLTPAANQSGNFSVNITGVDILNSSSSTMFFVNVTPVNDAPSLLSVLPNQSWERGSSKANAFNLSQYFFDVDNSSLLFSSQGTSSITVSIANGSVSFSADSSFSGTEYVNFTASDGLLNYSSGLVKLAVTVPETGSSTTSTGGGSGGGGGGVQNASSSTGAKKIFTGVKSGALETFVVGSDKVAVTRIAFLPSGNSSQVSLEVSKLSSAPSVGAAPRIVLEYVSLALVGVDVSEGRIVFRVPTSWFLETGVDPATVKLYRYSSGWTALPTNRTSSGQSFEYYESFTPGFSYFAISGEKTSIIISQVANISAPEAVNESLPVANVSSNVSSENVSAIPKSSPGANWIIRGALIIILLLALGAWMYARKNSKIRTYTIKKDFNFHRISFLYSSEFAPILSGNQIPTLYS